MRISQQQARNWFAQARVARLASADELGRPHLVPVVFVARGDVIVTAVDRKPKRTANLKRLRNIAANPRVALLVDHYEDDWSRLWWVRADGEAELADSTAHPDLLAALVAKYPQYRENPPTGTLIMVRVTRWSGWAFAER
ncbi:TIGR03668 family PPOX class F420-dependent oxidoreductase [Saccharopolyspora sp. ASAGF58]|uniref:TIGR03668 family PPOX class F420-dependent oxidoreductase n=1 Tax=Saccharopolyspora sp. ASAGF58 TaxID=2719023 RepID=UPI0014401070|nr:TIGR03668 family PPOX class F420-dependent oxidoreductase [Saccharopolyspora sp. ASAGF58]QIZ34864.1 TIGR03668 family PPOX class F420-dependent oxidoreductase [Saccharopolyspora sp. ASAGF58]